jgi:hypothetical protein
LWPIINGKTCRLVQVCPWCTHMCVFRKNFGMQKFFVKNFK